MVVKFENSFNKQMKILNFGEGEGDFMSFQPFKVFKKITVEKY